MTGSPSLNGTHKAAGTVRPRSGRWWPMLIVSLLGMNASIVGVTVYFAFSDKSAATEPDYYAKALDFDSTIRQREASARLGWTAAPMLRATKDGKSMELAITLVDREDRPVTGATVSAIAFASARSGQRQAISLVAVDSLSGVYAAPLGIDRSGRWNIRITATRGGDTFMRETDLLVPELSR
jgi:nitrogen fixation protein FixH